MNVKTIAPFLLLCSCSSPPNGETSSPETDGGQSTADSGSVVLDSGGCGLRTDYPGDDACTLPGAGVHLHYGPDSYDDPTTLAPYVMAPGGESTVCMVVPNPSSTDAHVTGFSVSERPGMHHLDLFTTTVATTMVPGPCPAISSFLFIAQQSRETADFSGGSPEFDGAAITVPAAQRYVFQAHAINTSDSPRLVEAWVDLPTTDAPRVQLSGLAFNGGLKMAIPPHTKQTIAMSDAAPWDMQVVGLVGHMHAHGTVETASVNGAEVYRDESWEEPPWGWFGSATTPLALHTGDVISWACTIDNTTNLALRYSGSVNAGEMCNLSGFVVDGGRQWSGNFD